MMFLWQYSLISFFFALLCANFVLGLGHPWTLRQALSEGHTRRCWRNFTVLDQINRAAHICAAVQTQADIVLYCYLKLNKLFIREVLYCIIICTKKHDFLRLHYTFTMQQLMEKTMLKICLGRHVRIHS